jgi:hypothetical protein
MPPKASKSSRRSTWAALYFLGYSPGDEPPFVFDVAAGDESGNIQGPTRMTRDVAIPMALNILTAAAVWQGLTKEERRRLRDLADAQPIP